MSVSLRLWAAAVYFPSLSHFRPQIGFPQRACLYAAGSRPQCCSPQARLYTHTHTANLACTHSRKTTVSPQKSELTTMSCLCAQKTPSVQKMSACVSAQTHIFEGVLLPSINTLIWESIDTRDWQSKRKKRHVQLRHKEKYVKKIKEWQISEVTPIRQMHKKGIEEVNGFSLMKMSGCLTHGEQGGGC